MSIFASRDFTYDKATTTLVANYTDLEKIVRHGGRSNVFSRYGSEQSIRISANAGTVIKFTVTNIKVEGTSIVSWELTPSPPSRTAIKVVINNDKRF